MDHPRCTRFSWVNPWGNHDYLLLYLWSFFLFLLFLFCIFIFLFGLFLFVIFLLFLFLSFLFVCDMDIFYFVTCETVTKRLPLYLLFSQILIQHWVGIRQGMRKVYFLISFFEFIGKLNLEQSTRTLFIGKVILYVRSIRTFSFPFWQILLFSIFITFLFILWFSISHSWRANIWSWVWRITSQILVLLTYIKSAYFHTILIKRFALVKID